MNRYLIAGLFSAALCACGGGGGGGGGGGSSTPSSKLFVADGGNRAIASLINSNPGPGIVTPDRVIQGQSTGFGFGSGNALSIPSLALDAAADRLFVASEIGLLLVFDQAGFANGNVRPSREINALVTKLAAGGDVNVSFFRLSLDTTADVIYTVDAQGEVHVFSNASARNALNIRPDRTIVPAGGHATNVSGIAIDRPRNALYVGSTSNSIIVYDNASGADSTPNGTLAPSRTIAFNGTVSSFCLDSANDRLYAAVGTGIQVFDHVSARSGAVLPDRTMNLGVSGWSITVEPAGDRLYAVHNNNVLIINNASTASGNVVGTAVTVPNGIAFGAVAVKP